MSATPGLVILFVGLFLIYWGLTQTGVLGSTGRAVPQ